MRDALLEMVEDVDERLLATKPGGGEEPSEFHLVLQGVRNTMSDRAAGQKLLNDQIQDVVNDDIMNWIPRMEAVAPSLGSDDQRLLVNLRNFYCGMHHLVHLADVMSTAANEAELAEFDGSPPTSPLSFKKNGKEASGVALVRKACKAFGPGADEKSGCYGKAASYLQPILEEEFQMTTFPITPFRGHRFNVLAYNSEAIYCLSPYLIEFLSGNKDLNGLTSSLLDELRIAFFRAQVRSFAIISKSIASPMMRMLEDKGVGVVQMGRHYCAMVEAMEEASTKPEVLLEGLYREKKEIKI